MRRASGYLYINGAARLFLTAHKLWVCRLRWDSIFDAAFLSLSLLTGVEKIHLLVMQLKAPAPAISADGDTVGPLVLCLHPLNGWAREPKRIPLTANPVVIMEQI